MHVEHDLATCFEVAKSLHASGRGLSLFINGELVAAGGVVPLWEGVAEGWILACEPFKSNKKMVYKLIKKYMVDAVAAYSRIQIVVRKDNMTTIRFAEALGFVNEGLMRKYDVQGNDYYRMARVR